MTLRLGRIAGSVIMLAIIAEAVLRLGFGLGNPPLFVTHPTIGYMLAPDQETGTLGRRFFVNGFGMRSEPLTPRKTQASDYRVLVVGDSVVNGDVTIANEDLATSRLERVLQGRLQRPVRVANASAAGWGPRNQRAYLKQFGYFDADMMLVVLSSHDYFDLRAQSPLARGELRLDKPSSALLDIVFRQAPRALAASLRLRGDGMPSAGPKDPDAIADLVAFGRRHDLPVCIVLHSTRNEIVRRTADAGGAQLDAMLKGLAVPVFRNEDALLLAMNKGMPVFKDDIHLTVVGQDVLAVTLEHAVNSCQRFNHR